MNATPDTEELPFASRDGMDVSRESDSTDRRRLVAIGLSVGTVLLLSAIFLLEPAAPEVSRSEVVLGTVVRGDMLRRVRGSGFLVPEKMRYVAAMTAGRVERIRVQPGEEVEPDDILLELSNPDVELQALRAREQWSAAQTRLLELRESLTARRLEQEADVASVRAEFRRARREAEADSILAQRQLIAANRARDSRDRARALATRLRTEEDRLAVIERSTEAQLAAQREQVERLRSIYEHHQRRLESMEVRAGASGIVQDLTLEVGQWVQAGTRLARVADPSVLVAELRVPQASSGEVRAGQAAKVVVNADTVPGVVRRVEPSVSEGTVPVEVQIEDPLPDGARADMSVTGTIRIEILRDVLHVPRPVYARPDLRTSVFRLVDGGGAAVRTSVRFGSGSASRIQVLDGLADGDTIILSDMSRWEDRERVQLD